jgi:hypothetical protein
MKYELIQTILVGILIGIILCYIGIKYSNYLEKSLKPLKEKGVIPI